MRRLFIKQDKSQHKKNLEKQMQKGRSMVEMLGVLAVVGVLSIGGIYGYKMAMNYYQANQIAHEVNLISHDLKIKVAQGVQQLTLGEPYDSVSESWGHLKNYDYEVAFDCLSQNDVQTCSDGYFIELRWLQKDLCLSLDKLLRNMSDVKSVLINEDNVCQNDDNLIHIDFSSENTSENVEERKTCENCLGHCTKAGECIICEKDETWDKNNEACVNKCEKNGGACTNNKACCDGYYCHIDPVGNTDGSTGTCKEIGTVIRGNVGSAKVYGTKSLTVGKTWWNACRWCEAAASGHQSGSGCKQNHTTHMLAWKDLDWQCYQEEEMPNPPYTGETYCKVNEGAEGTSNVSPVVSALGKIFGTNIWVWLKTIPGSSASAVYFVSLYNGRVTYGTRNQGKAEYIPLCQ